LLRPARSALPRERVRSLTRRRHWSAAPRAFRRHGQAHGQPCCRAFTLIAPDGPPPVARSVRVIHDLAQVICFPVRRSPATRAAFVAMQHSAGPILPLHANQSRPQHRHLRWETTVIHRAARQIRAVFHMVGIGRPQCVSNMQQAKIFAICRIDRHSSVPRVVTTTVAAQCGSG
jgi:hypothetical protein